MDHYFSVILLSLNAIARPESVLVKICGIHESILISNKPCFQWGINSKPEYAILIDIKAVDPKSH
jgi:hypothetical protein